MPTYSYACKKCGKQFQEVLSFREYAERKPKCPKCGSRSIQQVLEPFYAKTTKKS
jgi:putative FmdB family regulatory protein